MVYAPGILMLEAKDWSPDDNNYGQDNNGFHPSSLETTWGVKKMILPLRFSCFAFHDVGQLRQHVFLGILTIKSNVNIWNGPILDLSVLWQIVLNQSPLLWPLVFIYYDSSQRFVCVRVFRVLLQLSCYWYQRIISNKKVW